MTLRISISGPLLSGKTTLINSLLKSYSEKIDIIHDVPREAIESLGLSLCEQDPIAFQNYIGFRQLVAESVETARKLRILDKSLIDALAYWNVLIGESPPVWAELLTPDRYELVVICDYSEIEPITTDIIRLPHMDLREKLAKEIYDIASRSGYRIIKLSGNKRSRYKKIKSEIKYISSVDN